MAISNLEAFVSAIKRLSPQPDEVLIYRGHSDRGYRIWPSVLRNDRYMSAESSILRELVASHPNEFSSDHSTLEQLARVQHYSLPTRLLDVSWNPLVGLFFATNESPGVDGEVIVFRVNKQSVKFYDSDTASCIANLAHLSLNEKKNIDYGVPGKTFNEQPAVDRLLQFIRVEKPYFRPDIVPSHLKSVIAVKPKLSNRRLLAQSGAFLLFGLVDSLDVSSAAGIKFERIQIEGSHKTVLQAELDRLAINNATMFPEIEKAALYIRDKA